MGASGRLVDQKILHAGHRNCVFKNAAFRRRGLSPDVRFQSCSIAMRASVFVDAAAVEDADFDDRSRRRPGARRRDVSFTSDGFFAEDRAEEFFLRRHRRLSPFGVTLPTRMSPGPRLQRRCSTMPASSRCLRASSPTFGISRVISSVAEFRIAGHDFEFLDVDRGEDVIRHNTFGNEDRVLEVVAVPRHEGDEDVTAQREFTELRGRTVSDNIASLGHRCRPL